MKSLKANWKTTLGGLLTVALGVAGLLGVHANGAAAMDPTTALAMITGGIGLIFAKDGNVTGGSTPQ